MLPPGWQGRRGSIACMLGAARNILHTPPTQGFSDERHGDVVVVRPMRDHTLKEVAFYNRLFGVPSVFTPAIDTKVSCRDSAEVTGIPLAAQTVHSSPRASVPTTWCQSGLPLSPAFLEHIQGIL